MTFSQWIDDELSKRGWSRRETAKRAGISPSMIDKVINGRIRPGLVFYRGMAQAFKVSLIEVLAKAGELDELINKDSEDIYLFQQLFAQLNEDDKNDIMVLIRAKIERQRNREHK